MKTRYTPLVKLKKNTMDKSERVVQEKLNDLKNAQKALEDAYISLKDISQPSSGSINELLASRSLLSSQRGLIDHNKEWVEFASSQVDMAKERLKLDMIEYEKFKYLDYEEMKKLIKEIKIQESKELDEIALMTHEIKAKK